MKRYDIKDGYGTQVSVSETAGASGLGRNSLLLCLHGQRFENKEMVPSIVSSILNLNQAKILAACLQDLIESLEEKNEKV